MKKLDSRYAFVLTGTPLENRIDEIYSIVQFLDPELLGPLFRFNRNFYELDERGRPIGHRNLDVLAKRVSSVMLRQCILEVPLAARARSVAGCGDIDGLASRLATRWRASGAPHRNDTEP